jgi:hypothetical protein
MSVRARTAMAVLGVGVALVVPATIGDAAVSNTLPIHTTVTVTLKPGTDLTLGGYINSVPVTVTCTGFSTSGITEDKPALKVSPPAISGCTDSLGGTDTITTSQGSVQQVWKFLAPDCCQIEFRIPENGAVFSSTALGGCVVTWSPLINVLQGTYNEINTFTFDTSLSVSSTGCTVTKWWNSSGTMVFSPSPGSLPPWG